MLALFKQVVEGEQRPRPHADMCVAQQSVREVVWIGPGLPVGSTSRDVTSQLLEGVGRRAKRCRYCLNDANSNECCTHFLLLLLILPAALIQ